MSTARNLEPLAPADNTNNTAGGARPDPGIGPVPGPGPVVRAERPPASDQPHSLVPLTLGQSRIESTSRVFLILFVIGLIAFGIGAAFTAGVLNGWIDLQQVKAMLKPLKALLGGG